MVDKLTPSTSPHKINGDSNKQQKQHKNPISHSLFHSIQHQQLSHIFQAQPPTSLHHNSAPAGTNKTTKITEKDNTHTHTIDKHKENIIDHNHTNGSKNSSNNNTPVGHTETITTLPKSLPKPSLLPSISFGSDESDGEAADNDAIDVATDSTSKEQIKIQVSKLETLQEKCDGEEEEEDEEEEEEDQEDGDAHDDKIDDLSDSELDEIMDPARPKLPKEKLNTKLKKISLIDKDNDDPETIKNTILNSMLYDQEDKKKMEEEEEISRLMASPLLSPILSPPLSSIATSMSSTSIDSSAIPFVSLDNLSQQTEEKPSTKKQVKSVSFDTLRNPNLTTEPRSFTLTSKHENYEYSRTSRTFLVGYDENECSFIALKWSIDKMIHDGDTLVCLRVITKEAFESPENSKKNFRKEGEEILKTILNLNKKNKKIQIILEFRIGRVADMISLTVKDYNPIILIVGTSGVQKSGFKSMISSKSMSKNCLQYSTIPVIIVNPNYQFIDTPSIPSLQAISSSSSPLTSPPETPPIQPASNVNIVEIKIIKDNTKKNKDSSTATTTTTTTTTSSELHSIPLVSNNEQKNSNSVLSINSINSDLIEIPNTFEINFYKDRLFQFIDSELRKTVYAKFTDNEIRQINGFDTSYNSSSNSLSSVISNGDTNLLHPTESRTSRFNRMGSIKRESSRDTSTGRTRSAFSPVRALSPFRLFKKN
ncbi:hypothetical protein B5S33_g1254 [[Candida] boidinii]|nr:hypothetical protein B5S33_g1254 [[Candida] boidinii]